MKYKLIILLALLLLLTACRVTTVTNPPPLPPPLTPPPSPPSLENAPPSKEAAFSYVEGLVSRLAGELDLDSASDQEAVKITFDYLVKNIYMADPVGLDVWRYTTSESSLTYLENRALSPLLFKIGSCEDFAALQVLLLREAGLRAEYVAGYTFSKEGVFVDHAWAIVELQEGWYHLDPQLEHNISLGGQLNYQYFMRTDEELVPSHRWGESLINTFHDLTPAETQIIRAHYTPPIGNGPSYPTPPMEQFPPVTVDLFKVEAEIKAMKKGKTLTPIFLFVEPPILAKNHHTTPPLLPAYFPNTTL